jgi:hypothetical protein
MARRAVRRTHQLHRGNEHLGWFLLVGLAMVLTDQSAEDRPAEVSVPEARPAEVRVAEVGPAEVRSPEVRLAEDRPSEVLPAQVCLAEVWTDVGVLATPGIPGVHPLHKSVDMSRICHAKSFDREIPVFRPVSSYAWRLLGGFSRPVKICESGLVQSQSQVRLRNAPPACRHSD